MGSTNRSHLKPAKVTDKNGKHTTVYKNPLAGTTSPPVMNRPTNALAAPAKESPLLSTQSYEPHSREYKVQHAYNMAVVKHGSATRLNWGHFTFPARKGRPVADIVARTDDDTLYGYLPNTGIVVQITPDDSGKIVERDGLRLRRCVQRIAHDDGSPELQFPESTASVVFVSETAFTQ